MAYRLFQLDRKVFDWNDPLVRFGTWLSGGWLIVAGMGLWLLADWSKPLQPNAWGDLAAGIAAPLAFLWLVLGFLQQGRELKLQIQELRNTVQHQADLAEATREQVAVQLRQEEHEKRQQLLAAQPRFVLALEGSGGGPLGVEYRISLSNGGATATNVSVSIEPDPYIGRSHFFPSVGHNYEVSFEVRYRSQPSNLTALLKFTDAVGNDARQQFAGVFDAEGQLRFIAIKPPP